MLKANLILGILLLIMALFAVVQDKDQSTYRVWSRVDRISADLAGSGEPEGRAWELKIAGRHGDACALSLQSEISRYQNNIDLQLFREVPSTANCDGEEALFETSIGIDAELVAAAPAYLTINDQVWLIAYSVEDSVQAPRFVELRLIAALVDEANLKDADADTSAYQLRIRGSQAVGCQVPLVYTLRETAESILIGAFSPIAADEVCPAMIVSLDETITLPATDMPEDALIKINNVIYDELESQTMSQIDKVLTNIFSVTINVSDSDQRQVSLDVAGEHPDGCDYPTLVGQTRQGNNITVEVYREIPADVFCPMILRPYQGTIQLDGDFSSGTYTINVNSHSQTLEI